MHRDLGGFVRLVKVLGFAAAVAAVALASAVAQPVVAAPPAASIEQIGGEPLIGGPSIDEELAQQAALHAWLVGQMPEGVLASPHAIRLTPEDQAELKRQKEADRNGPAVVGRAKALGLNVRFTGLDAKLLGTAPRPVAGGILQATPDGGFVWAAAVKAEGAGALRLHLVDVTLPSDADIFFFSPEGQAFGPYQAGAAVHKAEFWTNSVFGQVGVVMLRQYGPVAADALTRISFGIADVGHIGKAFANSLRISTEAFCSFNVPCIENASCHNGTPAEPAKAATALMQWVQGAFIYTCTGTLLNDTVASSQIPYFLTANHCLSSNNLASNLETYFQFSISCGSTSCPAQTNPGGIQRLGASVMATGSSADFTLLQLNQAPPGGSNFLGWNNTAIHNTTQTLHRISHPAWAPQAYSRQVVDPSAPTCTGWNRGPRIYSRENIAGTEGGSSGSAIVNASGQVVGQLSGSCGTNIDDDCDNVNNATVDGALAAYWTQVQPFLAPGGTCTPVAEVCNDSIDNDCDGFTDCADSNCTGSPACPTCDPVGASCTVNGDCCSNKCKGPAGRKTCR